MPGPRLRGVVSLAAWVLCAPVAGALQEVSVSCNADPAAGVDEFQSFAITLEKGFLENVGEECLKPLSEMEEAILKITEVKQWNLAQGVKSAASIQEKGQKLLEAVAELAGGAEVYAAKCVAGGGESYLLQQFPQGAQDAYALQKAAREALEKSEKARATPSGRRTTAGLLHDDLEAVAPLIPSAKTVTKAKGLWETAQDVSENPERLASIETEVRTTMGRVQEQIGELRQSCDVGGAEAALNRLTQRARDGLAAARLQWARAHKQQGPSRAALGPRGVSAGGPAAQEFDRFKREKQAAQDRQRILQSQLATIGELCGRLRNQAEALGERLGRYRELQRQVEADVASCARADARDGLRRLANLASHECIERLTGGETEQREQLAELEFDVVRPLDALRERLDKCTESDPAPTPAPSPAAPAADSAVLQKYAGTWYAGSQGHCWTVNIAVSGTAISGSWSFAGPFTDNGQFKGSWTGGGFTYDWTGTYNNPGCISCKQTSGSRAGRSTLSYEPAGDTLHVVSSEAASSQVFTAGRQFAGRWKRTACP